MNPAEKSVFFSLPSEMTAYLFTRIKRPKDYTSLGQTCKDFLEISRCVHVIAHCSLPNRRYLLKYSLLSSPSLIGTAFDVIRDKNAYFRGAVNRCPSTCTLEEQFYLAFKDLCKQLNVNENDKEFVNCALDIKGLYKYFISSMRERVYKDMIDAYANQSLRGISLSSLRHKIYDLCLLFGTGDSVEIEKDVRQSLKLKKGRGFFEHAKKLQNRFPKQALVRMEIRIKVELAIEKEEFEKELRILDGPCSCLGSVQEAEHVWRSALKVRTIAYNAFMAVSRRTDICPIEVQKTNTELILANRQFCAARDHYVRAYVRKEKIEGELFLIETKLANIHELVLNQVARLVRFYFELDRDVTDSNKKNRHSALWRVINEPGVSFIPHPEA